jgi:hypothetical protein
LDCYYFFEPNDRQTLLSATRRAAQPHAVLDPCQIYITLRRPQSDNDPGEVARGYFTFIDGVVHLTDENGVPIKRGSSQVLTTRTVKGAREAPAWSAAVPAGHDARQVACRLLHQKVASEKSGSDFNRPQLSTVRRCLNLS